MPAIVVTPEEDEETTGAGVLEEEEAGVLDDAGATLDAAVEEASAEESTVFEVGVVLLQDAKTSRALVAKIKRDVFFINDINLR